MLVPDAGGRHDRLGFRVVGNAGAAGFQAAGDPFEDPDVPAAAMQQVGGEEPADRTADDDGSTAALRRHARFPLVLPQGSRLRGVPQAQGVAASPNCASCNPR